MLVDYHVHTLGHADFGHTEEEIGAFAAAAAAGGLAEVGFADHAYYAGYFNFPAFAAVQKRFPGLRIRCGMEVDYYPGQEGEIARFIAGYNLDYVIGSVHFIGDWGFDHPDYTDRYREWDPDALYRAYYTLLAGAARSGLFDIMGHLDLIKVFGCRPAGEAAGYAAPVLSAVRAAGLCVEINTNGRYKPVGEMYPAPAILERCFAAGIPVTLSSDAHGPENVGRDIALAAAAAKAAGYRQIATFCGRQRIMANL